MSVLTSPSLNNTSLNSNTSIYISSDNNDGLDDPSLDDESRNLIRQLSEQNKADLAVLEEQERLTLSLIHEEQSERQKELENRRYKCCLCLDDEVKLEDMITLGCQSEAHRFCLECFSSYCTDKIKDAIVTPDKLICPMPDCNYSISYIELKNNIPETVFEKYESFTMRHFGETSDDCRFCPKCNEWFAEVPQTDEEEDIWKTVKCQKEECQHTFCGRCGQQPHKSQKDQDLTCEQYAAWLAEVEEQERLTLSLIHEEQSERQKELENRRYKCCLCLDDEVKLEDMITLGCQSEAHRFCLECFSSYCTDKIKDAIVTPDKLICPMPDCNYSISYIELKNNIPETVFEKYESFTMRHFGETSDDCRFCPKCNEWFAEVPQTDEEEDIWKTVKCQKEECQHTFCGRCGQQPHKSQKDQDLTCEQYAAWQTANSKVDEDLEKYMKDNKIKRCPKCNQGGELKNGNCKFVYCRCGDKYCYLCGVQLEERQHYSHFQAGTTGRGDYLTGEKLTGPFGNGCLGPNDPG